MITVKALVLKHHKKSDSTFNVKIRITHNRVSRYIDTAHFVSTKQLNSKMEIKDNFVLLQLDKTLNEYRRNIGELGSRIELMSCDQVADYVVNANKEIDIVEFGREYVTDLIANDKTGSAANYKSVLNSLVDFFGREKIFISEINAVMLRRYEKYLRSVRTLTRKSRNQKPFKLVNAGLSDAGLHNHMRDLRGLFNVARNHFNDEDIGIIRIPHYPFKKYKLVKTQETKKRNLDVAQVKKIIDYQAASGSRRELARDLFLLSLYMCGTNSVDFYHMDRRNISDGRLEYKRSKTKGKRKDQAFISIKITEDAQPLIDKYIGVLNKRFSTKSGLSAALSFGMRKIQKELDLPGVTYYWARHTFATLARNACRRTKDDVAMALNHIDAGRKTTDIYIEKDWKIIDEVQEAVIGLMMNYTPHPKISLAIA